MLFMAQILNKLRHKWFFGQEKYVGLVVCCSWCVITLLCVQFHFWDAKFYFFLLFNYLKVLRFQPLDVTVSCWSLKSKQICLFGSGKGFIFCYVYIFKCFFLSNIRSSIFSLFFRGMFHVSSSHFKPLWLF